jgi:Effector Associated Constant Component 1
MGSEAAKPVTLTVTLDDPDADPERLDQLTAVVREELLDTDVQDVSRAGSGPRPAGSRAGDGTAVGELVVVLVSSASLLRAVIGVLAAWRDRHRPRSVKIKVGDVSLRIDETTAEQQERLVDEIVRKLNGG